MKRSRESLKISLMRFEKPFHPGLWISFGPLSRQSCARRFNQQLQVCWNNMAGRNLRCQELLKNYNPTVILCSKGTGIGLHSPTAQKPNRPCWEKFITKTPLISFRRKRQRMRKKVILPYRLGNLKWKQASASCLLGGWRSLSQLELLNLISSS